ncbi:probable NAD(P)H dehydrogenase (quinone) FQR1-like 1 [Aegilops tauschii subsp. strangulata]|uniref:NAD(P)H dehydrogenase (quinone) n=3 Tax=Aegilops tauschii TaxID=37682 RepID=A0A453LTE5_AEGTS|nr:probable NAD(P)H dehydrogenase (quinone) FQR1-like 1 [Aegilops tauschii subsp. strangulata]
MGKGGGCVPSKSQRPPPPQRRDRTFIPAPATAAPEPTPTTAAPEPTATTAAPEPAPAPEPRQVRIYVVFYSMYGNVRRLARAVQRGVGSVPGARGILLRVPETLPRAVLARMSALEAAAEMDAEGIPVADPGGLPDADGFLYGFPARYGAMAAQMQAFFDSTAPLCRGQRLAGKPAGFFVSTGTQCGGQETTAWTAITQLAHHGMLFVPIGYTFREGMFEMEELRGGSPYGAGVFAGDGSRPPSELELALAEHHGKYMATLVKRMVHGADA